MSKALVLVYVLLFSGSARAETFRVFQSDGLSEFDDTSLSPKPCDPTTGKSMRNEIGALMSGGLLISFTGDTVKFLRRSQERFNSKVSKADISYTTNKDGSRFGIWSLDDGARSLVIHVGPVRQGVKLLPKQYRSVTISLIIEADAKTRNKVACFERWSGITEVN